MQITDGTIAGVGKIRFDSPRSQVSESDGTGLSWSSWACGYRSGLLLDIDGSANTAIDVAMSSDVIASSQYGGHGETGARRITFATADRVRIRRRWALSPTDQESLTWASLIAPLQWNWHPNRALTA